MPPESLNTAAYPTPLGAIMLQRGLLSPQQLENALALQRSGGGRLGDILIGKGLISAYSLHRAVAHHYTVPFANLLHEPPEILLLQKEQWENYLELEVVPWKKQKDVVVLATPDITDNLRIWADNIYGCDGYSFAITTPRDIREAVAGVFAAELDEASRLQLWRDTPDKSARTTFLPEQRLGIFILLFLILLPLLFAPQPTVITALITINIFYITTIIFKLVLFLIGQKKIREEEAMEALYQEEISRLKEADLPVYTLLIPLYHEEESLPRLLEDIRRLDYPKSRLDVKLIIEEDDSATIAAAMELKPEGIFDIIPVPYSLPRTKPKACNYALRFAKGEYVTIYDAEDLPDPLQLKKAVIAFSKGSDELLCLQARLNYYNRDHNLLTRLFSIEYAAWFDYMLPALEELGIPIPLGGTSNHIALEKLRKLGEWDPYNVAEDADLGIRLAVSGGHTSVLNSRTLEEAPVILWAWMKQRTRWIKGYMQTWLVHMRKPVKLYRSMGAIPFWGFQFFVGGPCLVFLLSPLFWLLTLYWLAGGAGLGAGMLPTWILLLVVYTFIAGMLAHGIFALQVVRHRKWQDMAAAVLVFPFYWTLHSLASFRALWQLFVAPHHWEKTAHGLTPPPIAAQSQPEST